MRGRILIGRSRWNAQFVCSQRLRPAIRTIARVHFDLATRRHWALLMLTCIGFAASGGCSGQNSFLASGPSMGQLKTSLSQIELENDQLKRRVTKLEQENRGMEDRLVQEQIDNGDLAARLDDARNLLRDRGIDADTRLGSHRSDAKSSGSVAGDDGESGARTLPAAQSSRKRRKPPFARIPARVDDLPGSHRDGDDDSADAGRPSQSVGRRSRNGDDVDHHTSRTAGRPWLPVAVSNDEGLSLVR
jgi:hypothetical protein